MMEDKTIALEEFKNLVPIDNPDGYVKPGKFAFPKETHDLMVKNSLIGDKVFYHETTFIKDGPAIIGTVCSAVLV